MKTIKIIFVLSLLTLLPFSCKNNKQSEVKVVETETTQSTETKSDVQVNAAATFTIKGMTCAMGCAKTIEKKLAKLDGVGSAIVDFESELATVEFDANKVSAEDLKNTVAAVGSSYSVEGIEISKK